MQFSASPSIFSCGVSFVFCYIVSCLSIFVRRFFVYVSFSVHIRPIHRFPSLSGPLSGRRSTIACCLAYIRRSAIGPQCSAVLRFPTIWIWPFRLFRHCSTATTVGLSSKSFSSLFSGSIVVDGFVACRFPHSSRCQAAFRQYVRR